MLHRLRPTDLNTLAGHSSLRTEIRRDTPPVVLLNQKNDIFLGYT